MVEALNRYPDLDRVEDMERKTPMEDKLNHYGVPGMKWGVRKDRFDSADRGTKRKLKDDFKKKFNKQVDVARSQRDGAKASLTLAKLNLRKAKRTGVGRLNAEKRLDAQKLKFADIKRTSNQFKFGKESVMAHIIGPDMSIMVAAKRRRSARYMNDSGKLKQG